MKQKKPSTNVEGFVLEAGIEPALLARTGF